MFTVVISTLMIPVSSILVPLFMICKQLGITNSYAGILLPALFNAYGIFLFRQFYMSFPVDLEEAAKLDGCSTYRMFLRLFFHFHDRSLFHCVLPFSWATGTIISGR